MPVDMWVDIPITRVVHFPRLKSLNYGATRCQEFLGQREKYCRLEFVQLPDMLFQQQQTIPLVKLMVADDQDGVLKLVNEMRVAPTTPKRDPLTN
jgi:hypothetical protein